MVRFLVWLLTFQWLTELLTGAKKRDAEAELLKAQMHAKIDECKEASKRGDTSATLKLKELEDAITEKSLRLFNPKGSKKAIAVFMLVIGTVFAVGCGSTVTENHRTLNDLNFDAGKQLATNPDPVVAQVGADVRDNSDVLAKTLIGWPVDRVLYDAALSAKVRAAALAEFQASEPWYKKAAGYLLSGLTVLAVGGTLAARFFPATAPIMAIATPVLEVLTKAKQMADAHPNDTIHIDQLTPLISGLTKIPKIGDKIADKLKDLHLEQLIHSPEAPDAPLASPTAA